MKQAKMNVIDSTDKKVKVEHSAINADEYLLMDTMIEKHHLIMKSVEGKTYVHFDNNIDTIYYYFDKNNTPINGLYIDTATTLKNIYWTDKYVFVTISDLGYLKHLVVIDKITGWLVKTDENLEFINTYSTVFFIKNNQICTFDQVNLLDSSSKLKGIIYKIKEGKMVKLKNINVKYDKFKFHNSGFNDVGNISKKIWK